MSDLFKKYYSRVAKEGIVKSLLWALSIGFAAVALCALISWIVEFQAGIWVCLALFVLSVITVVPIFYFKRYRPTTRALAARIDQLGLEERVITMTQLEQDTSYMAMRQREDALNAMGSVNPMLLSLKVSGSHIATFAATAALSLLLVLLLVFVPFPKRAPDVFSFSLHYSVGSGRGEIIAIEDLGKTEEERYAEPLAATKDKKEDSITDQTLKEGEDGTAVYAQAAEGWAFVCWSDGLISPYRQDKKVTENISVYAVFEKVSDPLIDEPEDPILGTDSGELVDNGMPGGSGGGNGPSGPSDDNFPGGGAGGGRDESDKQIHDGDTYYGDTLEQAREDANSRFEQDSGLDSSTKGELDGYYDSIQGGSGAGNEAP